MASSPPPAPPPSSPVDTFPVPAWLTLIAFLVVVGICQWGSVVYSKVLAQRRVYVDEELTPPILSARRPSSGSLARLPIAMLNVFRVVAFRWTVELGPYDLTVAEVVLTLAYIVFLLGWTFSGTELDVTSWSNNAGLLAASQFPLVTALGTKNNVVSLVTGIGYEKLNFFHRVTARSCLGLLLIHVGGKIYAVQGFWHLFLPLSWIRLGITAVVSLVMLFIVSLRPIRSRVYELFFYMHFTLVLIFLIGAYYHTKATDNSYWIWPSFIFWALDRFIRLVRVMTFNHSYFGFGRRAKMLDANTELLSDDMVRIRVRRPPHFQWSPGQSAYLIMPSVSKFPLEAHPFSISTIDSTLFPSGAGDQLLADNEEVGATADEQEWKELVFLINVRGGFTMRLKEVARRNQSVKLFIDGPYGSSPAVGAYDTSIFVAGGTGITCTLPLFLSVIQAALKRSGRCRRVVFLWAVRDTNQARWISDTLSRASAMTPAWLTVSIRVFVTRGGIPLGGEVHTVDPDQTPEKEGSYESSMPPAVRMENGRPDIEAILRGEANMGMGSMSVTVCGPQSLTRSVRRALRFPVSGPSSVLGGGPSVTLYVESFGYA